MAGEEAVGSCEEVEEGDLGMRLEDVVFRIMMGVVVLLMILMVIWLVVGVK